MNNIARSKLFADQYDYDTPANKQKLEEILQDEEFRSEMLSDAKIRGIAEAKNIILNKSTLTNSVIMDDLVDAIVQSTLVYEDDISNDAKEYYFVPKLKAHVHSFINKRVIAKEKEELMETERIKEMKKKYGEQLVLNFEKKTG